MEGTDRRLRILAVDDDALVLMSTAAMLEDLGHAVTEAYGAAEALRLIGEHSFDLVLTDHAMPTMTGAQLARQILAERPSTRIILATGYAELPPGNALALPLLNKPFSQNDLRLAIERAMAD